MQLFIQFTNILNIIEQIDKWDWIHFYVFIMFTKIELYHRITKVGKYFVTYLIVI